jgi:hypothetical protein
MGKAEKESSRRGLTAPIVVAAALLLQTSVVEADPADKVHLPTVVQGEVEFELRGGNQWWRDNEDDRERQFIGAIAYGVTPWWKTELEVGTTRLPSESYKLDEIEWENVFALTEPGRYWMDLGLFAELARDHPEGRNEIEIGPMFQKEIDALQANLNVIFQRALGAGAEPGAAINYEWQVKWRGNPRFEPGAQGFGMLGRSNNLGHETQSNVGPALFGQIPTGGRSKLRYDAAVLFGLNRNTPDTTVRFQLEYELY